MLSAVFPFPVTESVQPSTAADQWVAQLRIMVAQRATADGRTDTHITGLRYYRFSEPVEYHKTQLLMPGLVVVLQGSKTARLHQQVLRYDAKQWLVLGREVACHGTVVIASPQCPYLAIHLDLPLETLVKVLVAIQDLGLPPPGASVPTHQVVAPIDAEVLAAFTRLLSAADDPADRLTIAPLVLEEIIIRLLRSPAGAALRDAAVVSRCAARMQDSIQFIRAQYSRALGIAELARHSAMSPSHYAHTFREVVGISPMRYLRGLRLDTGRALLMQGDLRASEVATQVGFESPEHFTREFKRRFGLSPTDYLAQVAGR
jgi:AraC-like DNA-binding protein